MWAQPEILEGSSRIIGRHHLTPVLSGEALDLQAAHRRGCQCCVAGKAEQELAAFFFQHQLEVAVVAAWAHARVYQELVTFTWDVGELGLDLPKAIADIEHALERRLRPARHDQTAAPIDAQHVVRKRRDLVQLMARGSARDACRRSTQRWGWCLARNRHCSQPSERLADANLKSRPRASAPLSFRPTAWRPQALGG